MSRVNKNISYSRLAFRWIFRIVFVIFSLYLVGDAFYRWDGFRYYAPFSAYLPSFALVMIMWSIMAACTSFILWLGVTIFTKLIRRMGWGISMEQGLLFTGIFALLGSFTWLLKRHVVHYGTTLQEKFVVLLCLMAVSILLGWLLRNTSKRIIEVLYERMYPLEWLFGFCFLLSIPLVTYYSYSWEKRVDIQSTQKVLTVDSNIQDRPNILLVTFDALSTSDMSVYDYHRPTTPFLSKWRESGHLFAGLKSASNITLPTTSSLMTGKRLWTHQSYVNAEGASAPVKSGIENLPLILKNYGYNTSAFIVNNMASLRLLGINDSIDLAPNPIEFHEPVSLSGHIEHLLYGLFGSKFRLYNWIMKEDFAFRWFISLISKELYITEFPPELAFNRFLSYINSRDTEPFFAWIHLLPPHTPYFPPKPYLGTFRESSETWDKKDWRDWNFQRERYDEFIRYCDKTFEDFIEAYSARKESNNTIILVSADHGESFEHGVLGHAVPDLYEQVTSIPLIIKEPDQTFGNVIYELIEQIDIPPTILDLAHIPVPEWMEGQSFVPLMRGRSFQTKPAFSMMLAGNPRGHKITKGTIAVWSGDYKLIHYLDTKRSILFNLKEDPEERENLFNKEPDISQRLLSLIQAELAKANSIISGEK